MKMIRLVLACAMIALLPGCISDQKLSDLRARHRDYVCSHREATATAANLAEQNALKIKSEPLRIAALAAVQAERDVLASCPPIG